MRVELPRLLGLEDGGELREEVLTEVGDLVARALEGDGDAAQLGPGLAAVHQEADVEAGDAHSWSSFLKGNVTELGFASFSDVSMPRLSMKVVGPFGCSAGAATPPPRAR